MKTPFTLTVTARAGSARRLSLDAYSGGPMKVPGLGLVVVDLAGMSIPAALPVLKDHANEVGAVVGTGRPYVENGRLVAPVEVADSDAGRQVVALLESQTPMQASIGATALEREFVPAGKTVRVNGQDMTAPTGGLTVVRKSELREISIVPLGADATTAAVLTAAQGATPMQTFDEWLSSLGLTALTDAQKAELKKLYDAAPAVPANASAETQLRAETDRQLAILAAAKKYGNPTMTTPDGSLVDVAEYAITAGWTPAQAEIQAMRSQLRTPPSNVVRGAGLPGDPKAAISAALMIKAGFAEGAARAYGERVATAADTMAKLPFADLCAAALRGVGQHVGHDRNEVIKAAMSSGNWVNILSNTGSKILEETFRTTPKTWTRFAAMRSATSFKPQTGLRPNFAGDLSPLPAGATIDHGSYSEATYSWQIATYAKQYQIDRKHIVDDDLNAFAEVVPGLGRAAMRTLSNLVYSTILANGGSHWHSSNANVQTSSALSATTLGTAVKLLRMQTDEDGNNVDIPPRVLLTPPALEGVGRALLQSQELQRVSTGDQQPTANPWQSVAELAVESRLESGCTSPATGTAYAGSATTWWLFGGSEDLPIVVGTLNGREAPVVESFGMDHNPDRLAVAFRCYADYGCALAEPRASVKSTA